MLQKLFFAVLLTLFFSCTKKEKVPEGILSKEKMSEILADIHLVEGAYPSLQIYGENATQKAHLDYAFIFEKHNTDAGEFMMSFDYFNSRPEELELIYEMVLEELNKKITGN